MTIAAIHQPQYVPYLGFFQKLAHSDVFVMLDHVQFMKNGLQNRNKIKSPAGWQWLTVPVSQKLGQRLCDVQISDAKWSRKHIQSFKSSYGRAPHFGWCAERIVPVLEATWTHLSPLNIELTRVVCDLLGVSVPMQLSSEIIIGEEPTELLIAICRAVGADTYLSGPGGRLYMDLAAFERAGIRVVWQDFTHPTYPQVFPEHGFLPNLSILDALCCFGPAIADLLKTPIEA